MVLSFVRVPLSEMGNTNKKQRSIFSLEPNGSNVAVHLSGLMFYEISE
jgi:hypothetical protein